MYKSNSFKHSSFRTAFFFLPSKKKKALSAVYDFARYADDIVDENIESPREKLLELKTELESLYNNQPSKLPENLKQAIDNFHLKQTHFLDIIGGVSKDLEIVRFKTFEDLKKYMYGVACSVGLICIDIFGHKNTDTEKYAIKLGYAVQLTNIVRDFWQDAKINRIYIPKEDLDKFDISEDEIMLLKDSPKIKKLLNCYFTMSEFYYQQALKTLPKEDKRKMFPAQVILQVYRILLHKIKKLDFDIINKKIKLTFLEKLTAVLKACL